MADVKATRTDSRLCRPARWLVVNMVSSEWRRVDIYFGNYKMLVACIEQGPLDHEVQSMELA